MAIESYLFFEGCAEEAAAFYREALGAETVMLMRYSESPEGMTPPGADNKVMHMTLRIGDAQIMCSDGHCSGSPRFEGFSLSLPAASKEEAEQRFNALADGGQVQMPLAETFWSPCFGMVKDRFGVSWMVSMLPS